MVPSKHFLGRLIRKSIKISVLGAPHYDTLVSNIDQPFLGTGSNRPEESNSLSHS